MQKDREKRNNPQEILTYLLSLFWLHQDTVAILADKIAVRIGIANNLGFLEGNFFIFYLVCILFDL